MQTELQLYLAVSSVRTSLRRGHDAAAAARSAASARGLDAGDEAKILELAIIAENDFNTWRESADKPITTNRKG